MSWIDEDAALACWRPEIARRHAMFERTAAALVASEGSLRHFCIERGLLYFGLQREKSGWQFREWAPGALGASLIGDFNHWNVEAHPCVRCGDRGIFEVFVADVDGRSQLAFGSRYKVALLLSSRSVTSRYVHCVPAWARATAQDPHSGDICALVPCDSFASVSLRRLSLKAAEQCPNSAAATSTANAAGFESSAAGAAAASDPGRMSTPEPCRASLRVYEVHVGICSEEPRIGTWSELRRCVLPRVAALGYTALLLLAVQEHGYYASFGYQVTRRVLGVTPSLNTTTTTRPTIYDKRTSLEPACPSAVQSARAADDREPRFPRSRARSAARDPPPLR